jgi:hypothetical protein
VCKLGKIYASIVICDGEGFQEGAGEERHLKGAFEKDFVRGGGGNCVDMGGGGIR